MSEQILPIKELREKYGMTQTDLAHAAGLTPAAISQFESGGDYVTPRMRQS